jgi:hypothetical protein
MAKRVNLDAMIPREDFERTDVDASIDLIKDFPLLHLEAESPIRKLLRKPDFQSTRTGQRLLRITILPVTLQDTINTQKKTERGGKFCWRFFPLLCIKA